MLPSFSRKTPEKDSLRKKIEPSPKTTGKIRKNVSNIQYISKKLNSEKI